MIYDVIIVGAGPAGLSAALILGRCCRNVLVLDSNEPRNAVSRGLHGYLTRDGIGPYDLRAAGRAEIARYPSVCLREGKVIEVTREPDGFRVATAEASECSRILLLATGRIDPLPQIPGFREFYGRGVYHCPYCDGWEHRDQSLVVFGGGASGASMAEELLTWSRRVAICTNGERCANGGEGLRVPEGVQVEDEPIKQLHGTETGLAEICFASGKIISCDALFFCSSCTQRSELPERLGCRFDADLSVLCENHTAAGVPGLFIAGNVRGGVHLAITAAAEGAEAAIAINDALSSQRRAGNL
ncbi:MAG: NAD(P)/FAD-dependent oxidoreductase [Nibricoccus sp.]